MQRIKRGVRDNGTFTKHDDDIEGHLPKGLDKMIEGETRAPTSLSTSRSYDMDRMPCHWLFPYLSRRSGEITSMPGCLGWKSRADDPFPIISCFHILGLSSSFSAVCFDIGYQVDLMAEMFA